MLSSCQKIRVVFINFFKVFTHIAHATWSLPFVVVIRLLRPVVIIRVGRFNFYRIGHFAADVGQRKAESVLRESRKVFDFWFLPHDKDCSNTYWAQIARRWFNVNVLVRYLVFWNSVLPFGNVHSLKSGGAHESRDVNGFLEKAKLFLPASQREQEEARRWMSQFGWRPGDPFVCLHVRDSAYLRHYMPTTDCSYHDYRDSNIETYRPGIDYLTSKGVFVFRMGKKMNRPLRFCDAKFVDYAFHPERSDFLDVWLFANCNLCITTGSGPDMVADVFRRPLLLINFLPLQDMFSWSNALHCPKTLRFRQTRQKLTLRQYLDHSYHTLAEYHSAGIEVIDLNDEEINIAVKEAWERISSERNVDIKNLRYGREFQTALTSRQDYSRNHGYLHPEFGLSSVFLANTIL